MGTLVPRLVKTSDETFLYRKVIFMTKYTIMDPVKFMEDNL